jgi:segregation and condensation protein B
MDEADMEPADIRPTNVISLSDRRQAAAAVDTEETLPHDLPEDDDEHEEGAPLEHELEALLFVSSTPLTAEMLATATQRSVGEIELTLLNMMQRFSDATSGIVLERVAGGWALRASDYVKDALARLYEPQADTKLTPAALETLAVVAYLQPISRPDVARIRGVSVDAAMSSLLERGFVEEAGRSETGAVQFRTTALFERSFGLPSVGSLPTLDGFAPSDEDVQRLREQLEQMAAARVE